MYFKYKALDKKSGQMSTGKVQSTTREGALSMLKEQDLYLMELVETGPGLLQRVQHVWLGKPVKRQEFVVFCRQLATLLRSGSTIVESMDLLVDQAESKPFRESLTHIHQEVRSGSSLSEACQRYPKIFNKVFVNMIRAGEIGGNLDDVMDRVALLFEKEYQTIEKLKSALMYPLMVGFVSIIVVIFLLTEVIPGLVETLVASGAELPLPTVIVLTVSNILTTYWYVLILVVILLFLLFKLYKNNPTVLYYIDYMKFKIPVFGPLIQKTAMARMSRTLSLLFSSAVPVLQAITMVSEIVNNKVVSKILDESLDSLRAGNTLSGPLVTSWVFPKLVTHMIRVGEETGEMGIMLSKIADFYEADVEHMSARLSAILEPLMILILAIVVGTIVLAALLPMFAMYQNV